MGWICRQKIMIKVKDFCFDKATDIPSILSDMPLFTVVVTGYTLGLDNLLSTHSNTTPATSLSGRCLSFSNVDL